MRPVLTPEEMAAADRRAIAAGTPEAVLMERAGRAVAWFVRRTCGGLYGRRVVVACGTGNNGGDGFVFARHASRESIVSVVLVGNPGEIRTKEARENWNLLEKAFFRVKLIAFEDSSDAESIIGLIRSADVVVDAIFGTGIRGRIRGPASAAIDAINSSKGFKVSVDVPSGLDPSTGDVHDKAVKADMTVTFHKAKPGLLKRPDCVGELLVAPIGIAPDYELFAGPGDVRAVLKPRTPRAKKGDFGKLLIVGGSAEYSGAPALSALAALRTGVDMAVVAAPKAAADAIRGFSPNLIVRSLSGEHLARDDLPRLYELAAQSDGIVVGPGLGLEAETREAVIEFVKMARGPILVDADAIKALSAKPASLKGKRSVVTPHAGEFAILTGRAMADPPNIEERMRQVKDASKNLGTTILLKAHEDIISDGERLKLNLTGNPGMTVGGTGDVLSGIAGAFLAWGAEPFRAACAAAFVSGKAGDLAKSEKGYHIVATDVVEKISSVMKSIEGS
ncbi:MAG: NAD(P)H-hydrate dehydratase [Candidatus Brockarchaeota archaeon]|nr:NAD(P)H-hydrate dehydratase [Candidatus Brockarchaeota archaeon]